MTAPNRKLRILFLPRWYPNRYDPMPGLFIQRQAEAITPNCDVAVIYVHPDPHCPNNLEVDFSEENEVRVLRVYFKVNERPSTFGKILALWNYYKASRKAFRSIREFKSDLVHAHILTRAGFVGWRIARSLRVPLVISEHWSRYFPENNTYQGWFRKFMTTIIVKTAAALVPVSEQLRQAMLQCGLQNKMTVVIPNVVDPVPFIVSSGEKKSDIKTMVHISCFDDRSKNISGFLRSVKDLTDLRQDFTCLMVGEGPDLAEMKEYAGFLRIPGSVLTFTGLKTGQEFAEILGNADFSVLSSKFETFGTVVIESLAYGVPVVATKVGIAGEVITDTNGMLVPPGDDGAMTTALNAMLNSCRDFDKLQIRNSISDTYSRKMVGESLVTLYKSLVKD